MFFYGKRYFYESIYPTYVKFSHVRILKKLWHKLRLSALENLLKFNSDGSRLTHFTSLVFFHTPLKTLEKFRFSDVFREYRKKLVT